jgi:hypothetical protein
VSRCSPSGWWWTWARSPACGKIEGVALVDRRTLALVNDNDFGMTDGADAFDAQGRLVDRGVETTVTYVRLPHGV